MEVAHEGVVHQGVRPLGATARTPTPADPTGPDRGGGGPAILPGSQPPGVPHEGVHLTTWRDARPVRRASTDGAEPAGNSVAAENLVYLAKQLDKEYPKRPRPFSRSLVEKYGAYVFLTKRELDWADRFFARYGDRAVTRGRLVGTRLPAPVTVMAPCLPATTPSMKTPP